MKHAFLALSLAIGIAAPSWGATPSTAALTPVERVDLDRYVGRWFEVALIPNRFQAMCASDTTATYAKRADGRIDVTNRCKKTAGDFQEAMGQARFVDAKVSTAKLQVRFAPAWLSWLPMVWGDYWVLALGESVPGAPYDWALVGEPSRDFMWVLSRKPQLSPAQEAAVMSAAIAQGYDTSRLKPSLHGGK